MVVVTQDSVNALVESIYIFAWISASARLRLTFGIARQFSLIRHWIPFSRATYFLPWPFVWRRRDFIDLHLQTLVSNRPVV